MSEGRQRGYFYIRLVGCLIGAALVAGAGLLTAGAAAGAGKASNYDLAYTTTNPTTSAPTNSSPPTISGPPAVGATLTAKPGTWSPGVSFTYQWVVCEPSGIHCAGIPGATGSAYNVSTSDIGLTIRVLVTATDAGGHTSAVSAATGLVLAPVGHVLNAINNALLPSGGSSTINSILKNGGYTTTFTAPEGGTVTIWWYFVPAGATISRVQKKRTAILVATGQRSFAKAGSGKLKVKLTKAGRKLLRSSQKLTLTAKGTFTPAGSKHSITTKRKFTVKKKLAKKKKKK